MSTLQRQFRELKAKADAAITNAKNQTELDQCDELLGQCEKLSLQIRNERYANDVQYELGKPAATGNGIKHLPGGYVMLSNKATVTDFLRTKSQVDPSQYSLGRFIAGKITGRMKQDAPAEYELAAQGGFDNTAGGFLVPDVLASSVLDAARAKTVVMAAGAGTIPMTSDSLRIPTVETDPTEVLTL